MRIGSSPTRRTVIDDLGERRVHARDTTIFRNGEPVRYLYKVEAGCVRTYAKVRNGGRFDLAFYFPGDYFGIGTRDKHNLTAEAVTDSELLEIPTTVLMARAATDLAVTTQLLDIAYRELQRAHELRLLLCNSADRRVAGFLLAQKRRFGRKSFDLVMPRRDIADHLNLTIESVSRALTQLHNNAAISLESQRRVLVNSLK